MEMDLKDLTFIFRGPNSDAAQGSYKTNIGRRTICWIV